jgi:nitrate reductase NapAB chaperone NapD
LGRKEKKMVVINSESSSNMDTSSESIEVCLGVIDMDMVADYVDTVS